MKVIFLDIDGVINSFDNYVAPGKKSYEWSPDVMHRCGIPLEIHWEQTKKLLKLISLTDARIVLSTSWRKGNDIWYNDLLNTLDNNGIPKQWIIGKTPDLKQLRGEEIQAWLTTRPDVTEYVVFDDIDEMDAVREHYVKTDHRQGLTDSDIQKALEILQIPRGTA